MEEEQEKSEEQKQINVIGLMKVPEEFRKMFEELRRMAGERLQLHEFQSAVEYYLKCLDMLDLGKNLLTQINPFTRVCLLANLAAAYQGAWKIQKCHRFCQKAEEEMDKLISDEKKEQFLKISKFYVTIKFQHCAILSQLNQHQKALEMCKSTLPILEEAVSIINYFAKKQEESFNAKCSEEGVIFSRKVYGFAGQILATLSQQLIDKIEVKQSKSSSFYFWEKNPQKNEEQLKKSFLPQNDSNSRRSILGVNKQNSWVDDFNIGSIMRMSQLKLESFDKIMPMEEYLFKDKLYQLVIQCSLAFFTIATEMRFIDSQRNGEQQDLKSQKQMTQFQTIRKKYGYEQKSQIFKSSQAYHLRSIQIISANIQAPIPYLSHTIKSYDKHYVFKKKLEQIVAIVDESVIDLSSIVNPLRTDDRTDAYRHTEEVEKAYGKEIAVINRQVTDMEDQSDHFNQYLNDGDEPKVVRKEDVWEAGRRGEKGLRNTVKLTLSQPKDSIKDRAKSVGKLRRNLQKQIKEDHTERTERTIKKMCSPPPRPKKKKHDKDVGGKTAKLKTTRMKLIDLEGEGEMHVRTKSSTHIKFLFKKKK